jgi:hypothetical protein
MKIIIINKDLWKFHKNVQEYVPVRLLVHFVFHRVSTSFIQEQAAADMGQGDSQWAYKAPH